MPLFVALLRGVNIGSAKRVPMEDLRSLLSELGYTRVATLLNSGNAVFHATKGSPAVHSANVTAAIARTLKIEVPVIVKSVKQLATIVSENPLSTQAKDHSQLLVAFTQDPRALLGLAGIEALVRSSERFVLGRNAAYLLCVSGILESEARAALLGKARHLVTTRNWATVLKLQALAGARDAYHPLRRP
jgi:uncharacterized protein (DUF1697 family)